MEYFGKSWVGKKIVGTRQAVIVLLASVAKVRVKGRLTFR